MPDKLQKLKEIVTILDKDVPSTQDVVKFFQVLLKAVDELHVLVKSQTKENEQNAREVTEKALETINIALEKAVTTLKREVNIFKGEIKKETNESLNSLTRNLFQEVSRIEKLMVPPDFTEVYGRIEEVRSLIREDNGDEIIEKINESEEKIDRERIEGLEDELKKLADIKSKSAGGSPRRIFQPYVDDFSSETDGSTKSFTLSRAPLKTETIMAYGTDFPVILRPTIDFTVTNKTFTLTDEVAAPSQGATLIVTYYA